MTSSASGLFHVAAEVAAAVASGRPVVALETTLVTHGLPQPEGVRVAAALEDAVRAHGAIPATIGILDGTVRVGITRPELERLAAAAHPVKVNLGNFAAEVAAGGCGSTTVAATMFAAWQAGIRVFATGGIGGVHRGVGDTGDVSADLTALAREKPGQLNFGTGGSGTLGFVAAELYQTLTGVKMVHVSYKGTVLAQNDLLANRVQVMFSDMPIALPQANAGKLRAIAVTSGKRSALLPSMPTVAEGGVPGYELLAWWGLVGPRGLPAPIVGRLHAELVRIHALQDIRERYEGLGVEPATNTPAQFGAFMREDAERFSKLLKTAGVKAD